MSEFGKRLIESAEQALAFANNEADPSNYRVHIPYEIDVKRIRTNLNMNQKQFAETYGFNLNMVQDWEAGRRVPSGSNKKFLVVLDKEPEAVNRVLMTSSVD